MVVWLQPDYLMDMIMKLEIVSSTKHVKMISHSVRLFDYTKFHFTYDV